MRIFRPVSVPELAYVHEAALWLAFGRVPDFFPSERGLDHRTVEVMNDSNVIFRPDFDGYLPEEFAAIGVAIDYDRYWESKVKYGNISGDDYLKDREVWLNDLKSRQDDRLLKMMPEGKGFEVEHVSELKDGELDQLLAMVREIHREAASEIDWVLLQEEPLDVRFNNALTFVIAALQAGKLSAWGLTNAPESGLEDDHEPPPLVWKRIPANHWAAHTFDPLEGRLKSRKLVYQAIHIFTSEMLAAFPEPMVQSEAVTAKAYTSCIIIPDNLEGGLYGAPRRGRKPAGHDLSARKLIRNAFLAMYRACETGGGKKDAVIAEAMEFSERVIGLRIARSTIQSYLKDDAD